MEGQDRDDGLVVPRAAANAPSEPPASIITMESAIRRMRFDRLAAQNGRGGSVSSLAGMKEKLARGETPKPSAAPDPRCMSSPFRE